MVGHMQPAQSDLFTIFTPHFGRQLTCRGDVGVWSLVLACDRLTSPSTSCVLHIRGGGPQCCGSLLAIILCYLAVMLEGP